MLVSLLALNKLLGASTSLLDSDSNTDPILQERLKENLSKWKAYKDLIHNADRFLHSDLLQWWIGKDASNCKNLPDIERRIKDTKTMQNKLTQMRNDINSAAFRCEAAAYGPERAPSRTGGTVGTPRRSASPLRAMNMMQDSDSNVVRLSDKVMREITAQLEKIDRHLGELNSAKEKCDRLEVEEGEFAAWLQDKEAEAATTSDVTALEMLRDEIASRHLSESLLNGRPELRARQESLLRKLDNQINQRRAAQQKAEELARKKKAVDDDVSAVMTKFTQANAAPQSLDQVDLMQLSERSTQTPCHQTTQTPRQTPSSSMHDLTDRRLYDNVSSATCSATNFDNIKTPRAAAGLNSGLSSARSEGNLRNSGGHSGISKQMWPYQSTWDNNKRHNEDPIESLRKTLVEMESRDGRDECIQTPRHRRTQTAEVPDSPTKRPTRALALKSLLSTVKTMKDELENKYDSASPPPTVNGNGNYDHRDISPVESIRRPPVAMGLSENSPTLNNTEPHRYSSTSPARLSPTRGISPASKRPPYTPAPLSSASPTRSVATRPREPLPHRVSSPGRRHTPHSPYTNQSSSAMKPKRSIENRYGLDPEKFDMYIPTKPHWREGPLANGHIPPQLLSPPPAPPPSNHIAPTPTPAQLTRQFIRDYDHMLHDSGNKKRGLRTGRSDISDSLDTAARNAQDMRNLTDRMRKSVI